MNKDKISKIPALLLSIYLAAICMACEMKSLQNDVNLNMTPVELVDRMNAETYAPADVEEQEADNGGDTENPREIQDYGENAVLWPSGDIAAPKPQPEEPATLHLVESPSAEEPADELFPYVQFPFAFTAEDIYGNTVTEAALGEKQLFLIHHWATWCGVCVGGLPVLSKVAESYGDRVGFIGLVDDYQTNLSKAKRIAESSGVPSSFIMLDAQDKELSAILVLVQSGYFPTSVIIDGSGEMFEPKLIGSYGERYALLLDILLE